MEMFVGLQEVKTNVERCYVPFTWFPPVVTSCQTIVQCHNQDTQHWYIYIFTRIFAVACL